MAATLGVTENFQVLMDSTGLENGSPDQKQRCTFFPVGWLVTTTLLFGPDCQEGGGAGVIVPPDGW